MEKLDLRDVDLKTAMWECHNRRCFYSRKRLDFDIMELDHIVSRKNRSPEQLRTLLKQLGRSEDFELDSVFNLVPCHPTENRRKSGDDDINGMLLWLHKAEQIAPRVIAERNRLRSKTSIDRNKAQIKSFIRSGNEKPENIYDFLADDNKDFPEEREKYSIGATIHYRHSERNVLLKGILPSFPNFTGHCSIVFRSLKIRGCIIELDHKAILNEFFKGMNTAPILRLRTFIKYPYYNDASQYWIQLGNMTFSLNSSEVQQLCNVIDGYALEYINSLKLIENFLGTNNMALSKETRGGYRLLSVRNQLWVKMVKFAAQHDYDKGTTPWHLFDANHFKIKICTRDDDKRYKNGYHAILESEKEVGNWSTEDTWIVWSPILILDTCTEFTKAGLWNPKVALNWLVDEFIPHVYAYYSELQVCELSNYIEVDYRNSSNLIEINSNEKLLNFVNKLQDFYYGNGKLFITALDYKGLLLAVSECLRKIRLQDYHYVAKSLEDSCPAILENILEEIAIKERTATDKVLDISVIEYYMRCIGEALEQNQVNINEIDIARIVNYLSPFYEYMQMQDIVEKYKEL